MKKIITLLFFTSISVINLNAQELTTADFLKEIGYENSSDQFKNRILEAIYTYKKDNDSETLMSELGFDVEDSAENINKILNPSLKYAALSSEAYILGSNVNIRKQPTTKENNIAFQVKQRSSGKADQLFKVKVLKTISNKNEIWHQISGYDLAKETGYIQNSTYWVYHTLLKRKPSKTIASGKYKAEKVLERFDFGKGLEPSLTLSVALDVKGTKVTGKIEVLSALRDNIRCKVSGYVDEANRIILHSTCTSEGETYKGKDYVVVFKKDNKLLLLFDKHTNKRTLNYTFEQ
ncbi:MAG: hypothetical protein ACPHXR_01765 [Flavicella sp.]